LAKLDQMAQVVLAVVAVELTLRMHRILRSLLREAALVHMTMELAMRHAQMDKQPQVARKMLMEHMPEALQATLAQALTTQLVELAFMETPHNLRVLRNMGIPASVSRSLMVVRAETLVAVHSVDSVAVVEHMEVPVEVVEVVATLAALVVHTLQTLQVAVADHL
jgi:hypothetical protein